MTAAGSGTAAGAGVPPAVRVVHTADLTPAERDEIRDLLDRAFAGRFDDDDWEHAHGGLHILVTDGNRIIAHAAVVQRRLLHEGRALRTGYVEAVAVDPAYRARGHAATVMTEAERIIRGGYELGGLSASSGVEGMYVARGWLPWQGPTAVVGPAGIARTPDDDDSTYVLPVAATPPLRLDGTIACDWRGGAVW